MTKILLIDDELRIRQSMSQILSNHGYHVVAAEDGAMGLAYLRTMQFDLVITDILMPNLDGLDVLNYISTMKQKVPVIAMSGGGPNLTTTQALKISQTRANLVMPKPVDNVKLLESIKQLLAEASQVA